MSVPILCGIYQIRNTVTGKIYIGSAVDIARRFRVHRWYLTKGEHGSRHLEKIRLANIGKNLGRKNGPPSDAARANMSAAQKGRVFSAEHRMNLSLAHMGNVPSAETRMKMSLAHLKRAALNLA